MVKFYAHQKLSTMAFGEHVAMSDYRFPCHDLEKGNVTSKYKIMSYRCLIGSPGGLNLKTSRPQSPNMIAGMRTKLEDV